MTRHQSSSVIGRIASSRSQPQIHSFNQFWREYISVICSNSFEYGWVNARMFANEINYILYPVLIASFHLKKIFSIKVSTFTESFQTEYPATAFQ